MLLLFSSHAAFRCLSQEFSHWISELGRTRIYLGSLSTRLIATHVITLTHDVSANAIYGNSSFGPLIQESFTTSDAMITGIRAKNARVSLCISDLGVEMADGRVGAQHRRY